MNCKQIAAQLISYLDGKASESDRREVEAHLAACAACRRRAEEFRSVWSVLDELPSMEPSIGFDARLRQRIAAEPKPGLLGWLIPAPRLAFAVSALLLMAVWISSTPPAIINPPPAASRNEEEFRMIENLQVLEDYDVLASLDVLSEVQAAQPARPGGPAPDRPM